MAPSPSQTRQTKSARQQRPLGQRQPTQADLDYAVGLIDRVASIAGSLNYIDNVRASLDSAGVRLAVMTHDSGPIFDWLLDEISYQGIADSVAAGYIDAHGQVTWQDINTGLQQPIACPKLRNYWQFHGCRYHKGNRTCANQSLIAQCPLPTHDLRNGHLNQAAYSLWLFIRDVCGGDIVGWINNRIATAGAPDQPGWATRAGQAVLGPLRQVYGVSDKVLGMALARLLIGASPERPQWLSVGVNLIAVDTLVHNFLVRTGILARFGAEHPYGAACYGPNGCAAILSEIAQRIDAREYNPTYPKVFPRFIQHAIWHYCANLGLDICNGNKIDDKRRCNNIVCHIYSICDRKTLKNQAFA